MLTIMVDDDNKNILFNYCDLYAPTFFLPSWFRKATSPIISLGHTRLRHVNVGTGRYYFI